MKPSVEQLENLLALRRNERPEEGYWQDFLVEFHHRQRVKATSASSISGLFARIRDGFSDLGPSKWVYGAGLAYAALTVGFFLAPNSADQGMPETAPVHRLIPAEPPASRPLQQLDHLDLDPSARGNSGEQVF